MRMDSSSLTFRFRSFGAIGWAFRIDITAYLSLLIIMIILSLLLTYYGVVPSCYGDVNCKALSNVGNS
jgi:hypothetical protein